LAKYFHLPINQVAKELGVCATILKKICRKNGIPRWPHRKIKSLEKMIQNLQRNLEKNPQDQRNIFREIELLNEKKREIIKHPEILAKNCAEDFLKPTIIKMKGKTKGPYVVNTFKLRELSNVPTNLSCWTTVPECSCKPAISNERNDKIKNLTSESSSRIKQQSNWTSQHSPNLPSINLKNNGDMNLTPNVPFLSQKSSLVFPPLPSLSAEMNNIPSPFPDWFIEEKNRVFGKE